jgi:uncharacterized membrane protein HdeD (DUF308 family)
MFTNDPPIDEVLAHRWELLAARGALAVVFGTTTLLAPGAALAVLLVVFALYASAQGVLLLGTVIAREGEMSHWVGTLLGGLASLAIGLMTFFFPLLTTIAVVALLAAFAVAIGVAEIATALRLHAVLHDERWLVGAGALSIAFGVLLALFPGPGVLGPLLWLGAWSVVWGGVLVAIALRLRSWGLEHHYLGPPEHSLG